MAQSWNSGQQGWVGRSTPQPGWQQAGQPQQQGRYTAGEQRYLEMLRQQEEMQQQQQMQQYWAQQTGVGGSTMQGTVPDASQGAWNAANAQWQQQQQQAWQYQQQQIGGAPTYAATHTSWQPPSPARPDYQQQQDAPPPLPPDQPPAPQATPSAAPGQPAPPLPPDAAPGGAPTSMQGWQAWPAAQGPPPAAAAAAAAAPSVPSGPPGWQPSHPAGVGYPQGAAPSQQPPGQWVPQQPEHQWAQQQQQVVPPPLPAQPPLPVEAPPDGPAGPVQAPTPAPQVAAHHQQQQQHQQQLLQQHQQHWGSNMQGYGMPQQPYPGYAGYTPYPAYHAGYAAAAAAGGGSGGGGGAPAPGGLPYPMHGQPASHAPADPAGLGPAAAAAAPAAVPGAEAPQQPVVQQRVQLRQLLLPPGRHKRAARLLLVLRGLPGSGKSHLARKIKEVEVEQGGAAPRVHSIDDYFMAEVEEEGPKRPGSKRPAASVPDMEYQYDPDMEEPYRRALVKAAAKSMEGGSFPLLVVDAPHARAEQLREVWVAGQKAGYEVVVVEPLCSDPQVCYKRNIHKRSLRDIQSMQLRWEDTPATYTIAAAASLLDGAAAGEEDDGTGLIKEVDMEGEEQQQEPTSSRDSLRSPAGAATGSSPIRSPAIGDANDEDEERTPAAAGSGSRWGGLEAAPGDAASDRVHKKRKKSGGAAGTAAGADSWDADEFERLERQLAELEDRPAAARAGPSSSSGLPSTAFGGGSGSGKRGTRSCLRQTPGSSAKKVRWPDEPNASNLPPGEGFRMAAEPQQLEEVFWVAGLGPRHNSWTGSDEEEEEALGMPAWAAVLGDSPTGPASVDGSSGAAAGTSPTAKTAAESGGVSGVSRKTFAQQVLAEHSQERASMKPHPQLPHQ